MMQRHFLHTPSPFHGNFLTATVLALVLLHNSSFNFHCYTQHKATPTQKSSQKCAATSRDFLRERLQSAFTLANQLIDTEEKKNNSCLSTIYFRKKSSPWRSSPQCGTHTGRWVWGRRRGRAPHHSRVFCGQGTAWPADTGSDSTACWHCHPPQTQTAPCGDIFHQLGGAACCTYSAIKTFPALNLWHGNHLKKLVEISEKQGAVEEGIEGRGAG